MARREQFDWTGCDLVERVPGKQGGVPLIRGTRIPADQIVEEWEPGSPLDAMHHLRRRLAGFEITTVPLCRFCRVEERRVVRRRRSGWFRSHQLDCGSNSRCPGRDTHLR